MQCSALYSIVSVCQVTQSSFKLSLTSLQLSTPEPSFSTIIDKLREENARLSQEVCELRSRADAESGQRQLTEEENRRLHSNQQRLEDQVRDYADAVDYLRNSIARCSFGLDKALTILEDLKKDTSFNRVISRTAAQSRLI